ncbi:hypothetical protein ACH3XW_14870 [Acanthocheilonema viteae]
MRHTTTPEVTAPSPPSPRPFPFCRHFQLKEFLPQQQQQRQSQERGEGYLKKIGPPANDLLVNNASKTGMGRGWMGGGLTTSSYTPFYKAYTPSFELK